MSKNHQHWVWGFQTSLQMSCYDVGSNWGGSRVVERLELLL